MPDTRFPFIAAPPPLTGIFFQDDDPLDPPPPAAGGGGAANGGLFAVLVDATAPSDVPRAPLDLVTVLDVSGSMQGPKLQLVKRARCFVIDQLGPADRLSVVVFSNGGRRVTRLARMNAAGKAAGLRVGAEVLSSRRQKNAVAAMILLSDGQDTVIGPAASTYACLVPAAFAGAASAAGMNYELREPGAAGVRERRLAPRADPHVWFRRRPRPRRDARHRGGHRPHLLLREGRGSGAGRVRALRRRAPLRGRARLAVSCLHRGVRVQEVRSGAYGSSVAADGRSATIYAGELYDGERRRFLVLVYVPRARAVESSTRLVKVTCAYRNAATGQTAHTAAPAAVIQRPLELEHLPAPAIEVERERARLGAADGIAAARAAADGGQHAGAARILDAKLREVEWSAPGAAGDDPTCEAIKEELRDLSARVGNRHEYNQTGRACLLAGMSALAQQRAARVEIITSSPATAGKTPAARAYLTPKMEEMVELSRESSRKRRGSSSQQPSRQDVIKQIKQDLTEDL
ncbi:unnamed protein product [Urochloa decumbens]|uniref:VWFA domain-containing protein n=1 Tax=Urochloa decumbens TaxID=240449 RepID=A0ABC8XG18_9POAL